jgi:hypothetical protein
MEEKILQLIGGSKEKYERILYSTYMHWCRIQSNESDAVLQRIMLDQKINKWYILEQQKLEKKFLNENECFLGSKYINQKKLRDAYRLMLQKTFVIYPKPLLEIYKAKRTDYLHFNNN